MGSANARLALQRVTTAQDHCTDVRPNSVGALAFGVCLGLSAIGRGAGESYVVFLPELSRGFDWARVEAASVYGVMQFTGAMASIPIGHFFDRWGPQRTFSMGLLCLAAGMALASRSEAIWQFQACIGLLGGIGVAALGPVPCTALVSRWYHARLNTRLGAVWAGAGLGVLATAPSVQILIDAFGWQNAYLALAGLLLLAPIAMARLPWKALAEGRADLRNGLTTAAGPLSHFRALKSRAFLGLAGVHFLTAAAMFSIHPQTVAIFIESGLPDIMAASAFGAAGAAGAAGMIGFGWVVDRVHRLGAILFSYALSVAGMLLLLQLIANGNAWLAWAFAFTFGPTFGARGPVLAATAASIFGAGKGLGTVIGAMYALGSLGGVLGSTMGGLLHDISGGYQWTIAWGICFILLPPALFLLVPELRAGRRVQP